MRLYFRSCSKVSLIEETNKYSTADINTFLSNIQKIQEELKERKGRAECNLHSLEKAYERIKKEIDASRQKINSKLDRLQKVTMQEVEKIISSSVIYITKERDECSSLHESMQYFSKVVDEVCNKSSKLLFIALEKCQQKIKDSEIFLKASKLTHDYDMEYAHRKDIEKYFMKLKGLGRVGQPNKVISMKKRSEYSVKMSPERSPCEIYAICELPTGETVVLDFFHNKVKLLDKKYQVLSPCYVSQYSYDLCLISPSEVVVTMNEKHTRDRDEGEDEEQDDEPGHELQMISVKNNRLYKG
ncbi:hypothetical protein DPMN_184481 [Dreissena polymorpha]|uniref:Uncharacterized protein n=1 Tax=Dreissena polymorpha TaxID=45954 RepID=A0A9D4I6F3_DREPO|nr:hypothetical protein DPMN_184481 [Dreissena polymorpha]